ncbi:hypothetical protein H6P81_012851 [Aristolochia fimbriata]|uniref:Uncharacterized protein n=1 Tax=Aristolochia fimbriata TaxID=158543 RepID=A0AAV7ED20_ARIFI|nr:hypothetical protein H6P81_012851 [Aristolochia fimbriata]
MIGGGVVTDYRLLISPRIHVKATQLLPKSKLPKEAGKGGRQRRQAAVDELFGVGGEEGWRFGRDKMIRRGLKGTESLAVGTGEGDKYDKKIGRDLGALTFRVA